MTIGSLNLTAPVGAAAGAYAVGVTDQTALLYVGAAVAGLMLVAPDEVKKINAATTVGVASGLAAVAAIWYISGRVDWLVGVGAGAGAALAPTVADAIGMTKGMDA